MNEDLHQKAEALLAAARVEGISEAGSAWLSAHLAECERCAVRAEGWETLLAALRSMPITVGPEVVEAARRRVRARALEWREQESRWRGLWMACVLSWLFGAASAPPLWFAFQWLGRHFDLPQPVWILALSIYWIVPAVAGAAALAWWRSRNSQEEDPARNSWR